MPETTFLAVKRKLVLSQPEVCVLKLRYFEASKTIGIVLKGGSRQ